MTTRKQIQEAKADHSLALATIADQRKAIKDVNHQAAKADRKNQVQARRADRIVRNRQVREDRKAVRAENRRLTKIERKVEKAGAILAEIMAILKS